ncbi:hypothetical protein PGTUg99_028064 [Puccinia graminis f. sp. tritici]|uniref:Uncharacterized protein n=1 Tax=Puccinia graminis f. sp. tritici TaxID=56615 RepID=A0A5B0Q460_PUCGR|nr:hypothetical protein PGTUg99_028064 [Puccinia graminis f. sp. tritici]
MKQKTPTEAARRIPPGRSDYTLMAKRNPLGHRDSALSGRGDFPQPSRVYTLAVKSPVITFATAASIDADLQSRWPATSNPPPKTTKNDLRIIALAAQ